MTRPARLQAAVTWRARYGGENIVRGYARWFGVDQLCAIAELRMLGVSVDAEHEQRIRRSIADRAELRARRRAATAAAASTKATGLDGPGDLILEDGELDDLPSDDHPF